MVPKGTKIIRKRRKGAELSNATYIVILYVRLVLKTKLLKIASDFGYILIIITNIINRFNELGTTKLRKRSGRP